MTKDKICKICGAEESESLVFHKHHIKPKSQGGSDHPKNIVDICNDCHFSIHNPDSADGDIDEFEDEYKDAIDSNIFGEGWGILPRKIAHNPKISAFAKILYCDISSLCAQKGYCWANNQYFAKLFSVSVRTVSRAIQEIEPYLVIRNRQSGHRTIWVHQLGNALKPYGYKAQKENEKFAEKLKNKAKPVKKAKKVAERKYTDQDLFFAELLLQKILFNFPVFENKKVNISEWADEIRKLREIEKAKPEQINFMIIWVHGGDVEIPGKPPKHFEPHKFWAKNILSAGKLRKQWIDNLVPQLQEELKVAVKKSTVTQL